MGHLSALPGDFDEAKPYHDLAAELGVIHQVDARQNNPKT
jgi:hypothetical protein